MKLVPVSRIRTKGFGFKLRFGYALIDDELRADVFLPVGLLVSGAVFSLMGAMLLTIFLVLRIAKSEDVPLLLFIGALVLLMCGLLLILMWRNCTVHMDGEDSFLFRNIWGKTRKFRFDEIHEVKQINGDMVLRVSDISLHIPECLAIISQEFSDRLDQRVLELYK